LAHNKSEIERRVHSIIDNFAERGLRSLGIARQVISLSKSIFFSFYLSKVDVAFKITLNQNSIVIYPKTNDDFKNHINFRRIKRWQKKWFIALLSKLVLLCIF
jgi:hypothetical protein